MFKERLWWLLIDSDIHRRIEKNCIDQPKLEIRKTTLTDATLSKCDDVQVNNKVNDVSINNVMKCTSANTLKQLKTSELKSTRNLWILDLGMIVLTMT